MNNDDNNHLASPAPSARISPAHVETGPVVLWAPAAWLTDPQTRRGGWQRNVLLETDDHGCWRRIESHVVAPPPRARRIEGALIPALVNAHCHAFQRAFAGLAEQRESPAHDDFWSWRDRMYREALTITPDRLRAVATQLYRELREGGYGHVCEFHYLHRDEQGKPYADPIEMARALIDAAQTAGIGLTVLPVVYERAGFDQPALRDDQRRFAASLEFALASRDAIRALALPRVNAGLALHSLRAVKPETMKRAAELMANDPGPIHIHVAEQTAEVDACLAATTLRPVEWLICHLPLDARWQLVHATHTIRAEVAGVAASGAGIVLCPTTEANLGDGVCDLPAWLDADVPITIGSDSNVGRTWREELRWLEYGQRLMLRRRNVAARDGTAASTGTRLFDDSTRAGAGSAGLPAWGLLAGAPATWCALSARQSRGGGDVHEHALDIALLG